MISLEPENYILLDNPRHIDYFLSELKDKYIPISCDASLSSYLNFNNIRTIGILDYLSDSEIDGIICAASDLVNSAIADFDESNRELYGQIFGRKDINFIYASMNYLFKRFVIGAFKLIRGLESIIQRHNMHNLSYLQDERVIDICGNRMHNAFFFPDNVLWELLKNWNFKDKPHICSLRTNIERNTKSFCKKDILLETIFERAKINLRNIKYFLCNTGKILPPYSKYKRNILLIAPFYDLSFVLTSREMKYKYNLIPWYVDETNTPVFLKNQPRSLFFLDESRRQEIQNERINKFLSQFDFDNDILRTNNISVNLDIFLIPLIKRFLEKKLSDMIIYWQAAEELDRKTKIDMFLWGGPPHKYPGGIVKEFFRLNKVPIFGMQHGGAYGSNYMGERIFDLDLNHCDHYFSYGFDSNTIKNNYGNNRKFPAVIPAGSVTISNFAKRYSVLKNKREKIKVLYPVAVGDDEIFTGSEIAIPRLFDLQKKIIDVLAKFGKYKIVLKFFYDTYKTHYLQWYINKLYPGSFCIIDKISFQKALELYDPQIIIVEQQSTPLNEALVTKSNIIIYNDNMFSRLTPEAFTLLSKRAIVCNSKEDFLNKIEVSINGNMELKDLNNREFLEKYCIYDGLAEKNIINTIQKYSLEGG